MIELGDVRRLQVDDSRVLAQRAAELAVADVDGVDPARAGLEEDAREAARCCAEVERNPAADDHGEHLERRAQLCFPAKRRFTRDDDRGALPDQRGRVRHDATVDDDRASKDL